VWWWKTAAAAWSSRSKSMLICCSCSRGLQHLVHWAYKTRKNPLMGSLFSTNQWFWQERILRIAHQSSLKEAEWYLFVDKVYWIIIYELVMNYIYIWIMIYHDVSLCSLWHYGHYMILLSQAAGFAMEDPLDSKSNDLVDMGPELSCVVSAYRLALNQIMSWAR
jgi:hypothetical protein